MWKQMICKVFVSAGLCVFIAALVKLKCFHWLNYDIVIIERAKLALQVHTFDFSPHCLREKQRVPFVTPSSRILQACKRVILPPAAFPFTAMRRDGLWSVRTFRQQLINCNKAGWHMRRQWQLWVSVGGAASPQKPERSLRRRAASELWRLPLALT